MPLILLVIPVVSTLLGGLLAVRLRRSTSLLMAFGAGLLLGAALLDLLPEALTLGAGIGYDRGRVVGITALSFGGFLGLQRGLNTLASAGGRSARALGRVGAMMLIFHSLRDGMAIGLAYAASHKAGFAVAAGIAAHDVGDGINTVVVTTRGERPLVTDYLFLAADALAPLAGGMLTVWWSFSMRSSVVLLAVAAGFFLQMATDDLLARANRVGGSRRLWLPAFLGGGAFIYAANLAMKLR